MKQKSLLKIYEQRLYLIVSLTSRLRETEPLPKGLFSRFGPKYRYCGKTFYQAQQTGDKSQRSIARVVGRKFVGSKSMETGGL